MTLSQQAESDRIERDRRDLEALVFALLLPFAFAARSAVIRAVRTDSNPVQAFASALMGNARTGHIGVYPTMHNAMLKSYQRGKSRALFDATANLKRADVVMHPRRTLIEMLNTPVADAAKVRAYDGWVSGEIQKLVNRFDLLLPRYFAALGNRPQTVLRATFKAVGMEPGNEWALRTMAETATGTAYNGGRGRALSLPVINDEVWGLTWRTRRDDRVRANHRAMEGVTRPLTDKVWQVWSIPAGFGCRCATLIRYKHENPIETVVPDVWPDPGFAGHGNMQVIGQDFEREAA